MALRELDAEIHGALSEAGFADQATYVAPDAVRGTAAQTCAVYIDRDVQLYGDLNQVVARRTQITVLRADLTPARNGVLVIDGLRYRLVDLVSEDDGITVWIGIEEVTA